MNIQSKFDEQNGDFSFKFRSYTNLFSVRHFLIIYIQ